MSFLPRNLLCLTLAHNINDANAIERWLDEYPEAEACIPIALRSVLETSDLPPVPFFSTSKLLEYLTILWKNAPINNKLVEAASDGLTHLVAYLLGRGANIHAFSDDALNFAVRENHTETVKLLLNRGANVSVNNDYALIHAAQHCHFNIVKLLLDARANIHARGDRALIDAAWKSHNETVKLLLDRGANIHAGDITIKNDAALKYAMKGGHTETVRLLLERKADASIISLGD